MTLKLRSHSGLVALTLGCVFGSAPLAIADDRNQDRFTNDLSGFNAVHFVAGPPAALRGAPAQILAQTAQGIDAGQFAEVVRAIRAGATYVNVHSSLFPPGEIRGPLSNNHHDHR